VLDLIAAIGVWTVVFIALTFGLAIGAIVILIRMK
jgi:hypothetical protein